MLWVVVGIASPTQVVDGTGTGPWLHGALSRNSPRVLSQKLRRADGGHQKKGPLQDRSRLDEGAVSTSDDVERGSVVPLNRRSTFNDEDLGEVVELSGHVTWVDKDQHEIVHDYHLGENDYSFDALQAYCFRIT